MGYEYERKLRVLVGELAARRAEALRLYEPLPAQECFHADSTAERLLRGSNRGGKTLPAAVEVARAVTGQDPHGKYPRKDGRCFAVGKNGKHVGQVMWRKLSRAGAFRMIRDEVSGLWRAYRPGADAGRERESRLAPPLIPARLIAHISWENKKEGQPSVVTLTTGWEIVFWSSEGKPPQGADVDLVWFDEEITDGEWYPEMASRLVDRQGKFFWSATPQAATEQLWDLHCRAVDDDPLVAEFVILLAANPHIPQEAKDALAAKLSDEEKRVRIDGEFLLASFKVYPSFGLGTHGITADDLPGGEIPHNWMRVAAVDPGHQVCAVLFGALPPPATWRVPDAIVLYDQLYLKGCDAARFAEELERKLRGYSLHTLLIDGRAARQSEIGSGKTIMQQYSRALRRCKVKAETTGVGFRLGSDDVRAGILAVRDLLRIRPDGTPRLHVLQGTGLCRERDSFTWEIGRYHFKRRAGVVVDEPEQKANHLMDCLRYLAAADFQYARPKAPKKAESYVLKALKAKRERARQRAQEGDGSHVHLGPGKGGSRW